MRILLIALIVLGAVPSAASAETDCTDRPECWPEGSSMRTGLLLVQQEETFEKQLAGKHEELVNLVASASENEIKADEMLLAALRTQQAAWLKYRDEECALIGTLTGAGGTWSSTYARRCAVNHTQQRLSSVQSAIRCIEKIPAGKRLFEQNNCLQQLAPLTNK